MANVPFYLVDAVIKAITSPYVRVTARYQGSRRVMFKCTLTGTTFSGHPTRTTFGNTLRSILYM